MNEKRILQSYELAKELYSELGIDTDAVISRINGIPISMHAWQGDDLLGFEGSKELTGGIQATGNYPGRATTADELRGDIEEALKAIPGRMKVSLHSIHAEGGSRKFDRDTLDVSLFENWIGWAIEKKLGLDFNPTFFSHPKADSNLTLTNPDKGIRDFWIEHGKRCREISEEMGRRTGEVTIDNVWMPDGYKDIPADTRILRERMIESLDEIMKAPLNKEYTRESLESKLFGLGLESYTVASHEFSLLYSLSRGLIYTLDAGHFHPTESIAAKFSAIMCFAQEAMLHISRGVRWDSDHVVVWDDALQDIMNQIIYNGFEERIHIGLDFFDASINRLACWIIGVRNARKALLRAALSPIAPAKAAEAEGDFTARLALLEEIKSLPDSAVWDYYCLSQNVYVGQSWVDEIKRYEREVTFRRD